MASPITTTGSSLKSDTKPAAVLEAALLVDAAEKSRNGANPGVTPKNNVTVSFAVDEGVAAIAATVPVSVVPTSSGGITYNPSDYLGAAYTAFTAGGDVTATNCIAAFVQVAQMLSAAEKSISPVEDQPNNIQVDSSSETGLITISATLPVSSSIDATTGAVTFTAVDYL